MRIITKSYGLQKGKLKITLELSEDAVNKMDKEKLRNILGDIAEKSHNFYLEAGKSLTGEYFVCPNCGMPLCEKNKLKSFEESYCTNCGVSLPSTEIAPDSEEDLN